MAAPRGRRRTVRRLPPHGENNPAAFSRKVG